VRVSTSPADAFNAGLFAGAAGFATPAAGFAAFLLPLGRPTDFFAGAAASAAPLLLRATAAHEVADGDQPQQTAELTGGQLAQLLEAHLRICADLVDEDVSLGIGDRGTKCCFKPGHVGNLQ
jgi:hypothetical protein